MVKVLLLLALGGLVLLGLHRLAVWAEERGWVYYRHRRPSRSALGRAFLEVQSMLEPEKRALLEACEEQPEEPGSGDPPEPGRDSEQVSDRP